MYIRTKNRIYQVESILRDDGFVKGYNVGYMAFITKDQVINQSENLEELCDCFVAIRKNASGTYSVFFIEFEDWKTWINGYDIYGAIWTSKGLIYVAKMNEEGVLCLI